MRKWSGDSPLEGHSPVAGLNERFCLGRKFGCWPGDQQTMASRLSLIDGHQLFAETLFVPMNGNCIAASGS